MGLTQPSPVLCSPVTISSCTCASIKASLPPSQLLPSSQPWAGGEVMVVVVKVVTGLGSVGMHFSGLGAFYSTSMPTSTSSTATS